MASNRSSNKSKAIITAIRLTHEISPPLHYDLVADIDDVASDIKRSQVGEPPLADFDDHLKSAVRSLFGQIEALTHCLTTAVLQHFASEPSSLANADRSVLEERDYDAATDSMSSRARRYSLARRFEVSSRVLLYACGAQPAPAWDSETTHHFQTLTRARNAFTHPARIEDLIITPCFEAFRHMAAWFPAQAIYILASAAEKLGLPRLPSPASVAFPPLTTPMPEPKNVFDDDFYKRVFSEPAIAIRYIALFSRQLDDDLSRAFDHCRSAVSPPYDPPKIGRAIRRMIRAITTNVEGTIGFASFFIRAVRFSGAKVVIPQPPKGELVPDRMIRVLTAFSSAFGNDVTPGRTKAWDSLVLTFDIRDRLTHPRTPRDVTLTLNDLDAPMKALDWLWGPAHEAVLLKPDKIARTVGVGR